MLLKAASTGRIARSIAAHVAPEIRGGSMARRIDHVGQRFGRLEVLAAESITHYGETRWRCRCDCGEVVFVLGLNLRTGHTRSCGCLARELRAAWNRVSISHGAARNGQRAPEYWTWQGAKDRCFNSRNRMFRYYGARGISMCKEWRRSFSAFLADMGPRPSPQHSIDRINNDGHYEPGNVRWATRSEQRRNRRDYKERCCPRD